MRDILRKALGAIPDVIIIVLWATVILCLIFTILQRTGYDTWWIK